MARTIVCRFSLYQFAFDSIRQLFLDVIVATPEGRNVVSVRFDVDEDRSRTDARDAPRGREKRVGRGDNSVAEADFERHQNGQRRASVPDETPIGVGRAAVGGYRPFEPLHFWAKDETAACQNVVDRLPNGIAQDTIFFAKVEQRHAHGQIAWQFRHSIQDVVVPSRRY